MTTLVPKTPLSGQNRRENKGATVVPNLRFGVLPEVGIAIGILALVALVASCCAGCGASAATRSAYALEQARCIANEREIVDRQGTTEEQDREAMTAERARCDAALHEIEVSDGR